MLIKQASWVFVALCCLATSNWYFRSPKPITRLDPKTLATTADISMTDFTLHVYDTQGKLLNELQSPLVRHIPQNNTNWLKNPHIIMTENNQSEWRIDAEEATTKNGGEEIVFNKRVVIKQLSNKQSVQSTFKTDSLTYFPQKKFATTTDHITFIQPGHVVKAKGMNAYLAEKRIQLLSHTRGIYEPTKH